MRVPRHTGNAQSFAAVIKDSCAPGRRLLPQRPGYAN